MPSPDAACRAVLADLLEKIAVRVEEERQAWREGIDVQAPLHGGFDVSEAVGQRERELLHRGRSSLANVITADRNRMEAGHVVRRMLDRVDDETHGRLGRVEIFLLRDVFLEDVVLNRAAQLRRVGALLFRRRNVEGPDDGGGAVDRHRSADVLERNAVEERFHVTQAGDGDAAASDLALGALVPRVDAHERRHVERHGESGATLTQQVLVALVRFARGPEAGELAHRPQSPTVHVRVRSTRERELAGCRDVVRVVETLGVGRCVERIEPLTRQRREIRRAWERAPQHACAPARRSCRIRRFALP